MFLFEIPQSCSGVVCVHLPGCRLAKHTDSCLLPLVFYRLPALRMNFFSHPSVVMRQSCIDTRFHYLILNSWDFLIWSDLVSCCIKGTMWNTYCCRNNKTECLLTILWTALSHSNALNSMITSFIEANVDLITDIRDTLDVIAKFDGGTSQSLRYFFYFSVVVKEQVTNIRIHPKMFIQTLYLIDF